MTKKYLRKGVYVDFRRGVPETTVRKHKGFRQSNFIRGVEAGQLSQSQKDDLSQIVLGF